MEVPVAAPARTSAAPHTAIIAVPVQDLPTTPFVTAARVGAKRALRLFGLQKSSSARHGLAVGNFRCVFVAWSEGPSPRS